MWEPVTGGESGDAVFRGPDGARYAKRGRPDQLVRERDRIQWLSAHGVPGPTVLDWRVDGDLAWLVTSAVRGVTADAVTEAELLLAWPSITDAVRALHELPACPFNRDLARMFALAQDVVGRGAVNPEFLPVEQQDTSPAELLARLAADVDRWRAREELVVCHGDLCLPNIVLEPGTFAFAGFVDLGRLGLADRYADISLLLANSRETWRDEQRAVAADEAFARRYGITLDAPRQRFYLHLDPLTWG